MTRPEGEPSIVWGVLGFVAVWVLCAIILVIVG